MKNLKSLFLVAFLGMAIISVYSILLPSEVNKELHLSHLLVQKQNELLRMDLINLYSELRDEREITLTSDSEYYVEVILDSIDVMESDIYNNELLIGEIEEAMNYNDKYYFLGYYVIIGLISIASLFFIAIYIDDTLSLRRSQEEMKVILN